MVHLEQTMRHVLFVTAVWAVGARGFLTGRTDCQMSFWSPWSEPFGFGQVSRERSILRYPTNGGTPCPTKFEETIITGTRPNIEITAKSMALNFMDQLMIMSTTTNGSTTNGFYRDLLVIVDGSGSVGNKSFHEAKHELARLLGMVCPIMDPFEANQIKGHHQAALIEFSSTVREIFDFNDKATTAAVQEGIIGMQYFGGTTCTATAFNFARNTMFTAAKGMRSQRGVKQEVLILTDGLSNCGGNAVQAAKLLNRTATVYGLMIGTYNTAGIEELTDYVSAPKNKHLFTLENATQLSQLVDLVVQQLNESFCAPFVP